MDSGYVIPAAERVGPLREMWLHRGLLWSLTLREVQVRYRQALLGVVWAVLQPVALMAVTTLVFHRGLGVDVGETPYALFVLVGLVPWTFFHTAVTTAVPSLVTNADLVRKIYFPREALPLASIGAAVLDLAVGVVLLVLVLLVSREAVLSPALVLVPILLVVLIATAVGPSLLGAAVNVYYRDVKHALPLLLQVLFFATPIVYRLADLPAWAQWLLRLNPLTAVVVGLRASLLEGRFPAVVDVLPGTVVALGLLAAAHVVFRRASRHFADVV